MKTITVEMIREWYPCYDPVEVDGVGEDWTGTAIDVLKSTIPHDDKLWLVLRDELLPEMLLLDFGRWCALQVIDLWEAPQIVIDYLKTGDDKKRDAAWAAAGDAAGAAARSAAWAAAWAAAGDAAWAAAGAAARAAAGDAAWAAARSAAWAAAWAAAGDAAWAAARSAAWDAQLEKLAEMIMKLEAA